MIVVRNDKVTIKDIEALHVDRILLSPGPGRPMEAGVCSLLVRHFGPKDMPIGGICLGMQVMFEVYGGTVGKAHDIVHGKTSVIECDQRGFFHGLPSTVTVTRYHSLIGLKSTLPTSSLIITSWVKGQNDTIMGIRHRQHRIEGVQFHPESILTQHGKKMMENFLTL